jgi:hypothetical protein
MIFEKTPAADADHALYENGILFPFFYKFYLRCIRPAEQQQGGIFVANQAQSRFNTRVLAQFSMLLAN